MRIEALEDLRKLRVEIEKCVEMEESFRSAAERMTNLLSGMPTGGTKKISRIEEYTLKLVQTQAGRRNLELEFLTLQMQWRARISSAIDDKIIRQVLFKRYIDGESWQQIAVDLNCSERQVFRFNRKGLKLVAQHYNLVSNLSVTCQ